MEHSEAKVKNQTDGLELYVQRWYPSAGIKANLLILHGYMEHCGRYAEFAKEGLVPYGISTYAFDFRGHGKSEGTPRGCCKKFGEYHTDVDTVIDFIQKDSDNKDIPLFVLGHSNGGLILLDQYSTHGKSADGISGFIITSPFMKPAGELPWIKVQVSKILGGLAPNTTLSSNDVTPAMLTSDETKQKEHDDDKLVIHNISLGWASQAMIAQSAFLADKSRTLSKPFLFVVSGKDQVADPQVNRDVAKLLEHEDKTVVIKEDDCHECLNERNRTELYEQIRNWVLKHI